MIFSKTIFYKCKYTLVINIDMENLQQLLSCGKGHKRIDDDLFKSIDNTLKIYRREGIFEIEEQINKLEKIENFHCNVHGCTASFMSMVAYDSHYNSNHRYSCIYCRKLLQSAHLLDLHLSETHDNFFSVASAKKPMFKCLIETCHSQFWNSKERNDHCTEIHKLSQQFLLHHGNKKNQKKGKVKNNGTSSTTGLNTMSDLNMVID